MKVHHCQECGHLQNDRQFLYRRGLGVRRYLVCKMCRYPAGGEVECKTQVCPDCSKPSPRSNFCVFFQGLEPILKENCTSCRFLRHESDTMRAIESENKHYEMSAVLKASIEAWEKEYISEPKPSLIERVRLWITRRIKRP